jgi:glutaminyl-peptide cyclotransferase
MAKSNSSFPLFLLLRLLLLTLVEAYATLTDATLQSLPRPGADFDIKTGSLLAPILIPRVPGTPGSTAVLNHFVDFFKTSLPEWHLTFQNSTSVTPAFGGKEIPFVNLIATRDPPWTQPGEVGRLTLVAHYDSKLYPTGFIGAIDSAAPCAMLMHMARSVDAALTKKWAAMAAEGLDDFAGMAEEKGLQILFLDGEEAFVTWTDTDSLYGARYISPTPIPNVETNPIPFSRRSLAAEWEKTPNAVLSTYRTPLSSISLFLLLDLLGSPNPTVPSYFRTTHWAYRHMSNLESRLRSLSLFRSSPNHPSKRGPETTPKGQSREPVFLTDGKKASEGGFFGGGILDDHIPFLARGVEVLHIIPSPFPYGIWHELADDGEHLDMDTVEDWAVLVTAFVAEWMELEGFFDVPATLLGKRGDDENRNAKAECKSEL